MASRLPFRGVSLLEVDRLGKVYSHGGRTTEAIRDVSFSVDNGELLSVIGPSGCGKTTLLRCVAGLTAPTSGAVVLRGQRVVGPPDEMAFVFQDYSRSLYPWMTVAQNVRFPLRSKRLPKAEREDRTEKAVKAVDLDGFLEHYPWELSGGMQQRVAIARALAYRPSILLMDEPFASVDAQTRADLEDLTLRVAAEFGITIVFVTHDIDEAVYVGDRIVVLSHSPGRVRETMAIDLAKPRDQIDTRSLPEFTALRTHVHRAIKRRSQND
jgi:NitT/TauT family transport system ATP-binding protein